MALTQTHNWYRGGPPRKGKEEGGGKGGKGVEKRGREGRESRNVQIQSWQAYSVNWHFLGVARWSCITWPSEKACL